MIRRLAVTWLLFVLVAACGSAATPGPSGSASPSAPSPTASSVVPSPSVEPSVGPTVEPSVTPSPTTVPTPTPTATATTSPTPTPPPATMIVRAYFFLADRAGGDPTLVPVLRTVPTSSATARAAMEAVLAGPSAKERAASPRLSTMIPAGTTLNGVRIANGTATVDLSAAYATGAGTFSVRGRLAQVVYTLTQFSTVDRVRFELDGQPVTTFSSEGVVLDAPVSRATYRDAFLPAIWVDRPAWGAGMVSGSHVTGLANVFEAQFRMAVLDASGATLADRQVTATCGSGCWGSFDTTLPYTVSKAQWGTLRVWDVSEGTSQVIDLREYPIYLRPAP